MAISYQIVAEKKKHKFNWKLNLFKIYFYDIYKISLEDSAYWNSNKDKIFNAKITLYSSILE